MRAIRLVKNTIDIPFVDDEDNVIYTLHFDRTDENRKKLMKSIKELEKQYSKLDAKAKSKKEDADEAFFDEATAFVKKTTDDLLGEGSFDKMFEINPFIEAVAKYLYQIMIGIKEEFEEEDLKAVESKYLG